MSFQPVDNNWIPLQIKVFTRWVSNQLKNNITMDFSDITKDLNNGVALIELARILTNKDTPRAWVKFPKRKIDMVQNCDLAIEMFSKDGVKIVGISGKDVNDNNEKLILGLIWSLITHYSITQSVNNQSIKNNASDKLKRKNSEDTLKNWAIDRTSNYPNVTNFKPYDLAMCALLDSYVPDKINFYSLDPKDSANNSILAEKVMKELGIPILVNSCEMKNEKLSDEKSILTQLSYAKVKLESLQNQPLRLMHHKSSKMSTMSLGLTESTEGSFDVDYEVDKIVEETNMKVAEILEKSWPFNGDTETENEEEDYDESEGQITSETKSENTIDSNSPLIVEKLKGQISSENENRESDESSFVPIEIEEDNFQYHSRKFGLVMHLNDGFGDTKMALTVIRNNQPFLNPAGLKLDLSEANIENDINQQFLFGINEWNTVIDSAAQQGMVWDVADPDNSNPPAGTPFYLFPFHGRHNQRFVYINEKIYAKQNGMVVTYVGGQIPFQMLPPSQNLKSRQTFQIQFLPC